MGWYYEAPEPDVGLYGGYFCDSYGTATFEFQFNNTELPLDNDGDFTYENPDVYEILKSAYVSEPEDPYAEDDDMFLADVDIIEDGYDAEVIVGSNLDDIGLDILDYIGDHYPQLYELNEGTSLYSAIILNGSVKFTFDVSWMEYDYESNDDDERAPDVWYSYTYSSSAEDYYDELDMTLQDSDFSNLKVELVEK